MPPIQTLDASAVSLMTAISSGAPDYSGKPSTVISYAGINPDSFTAAHRQRIQAVIDRYNLGSVLEITGSNDNLLVIDRSTGGKNVRCDLCLADEAMAVFDNSLVPGLFIFDLMFQLAIISDPVLAEDPAAGEMFIDFSRKGFVLWADQEDDDYLPYTWSDVKTLLTL